MSKHTPGPWFVNGKQSVRGPNGEYILKTNWNNGSANAMLAAAAPDLLAALEASTQYIAGLLASHPDQIQGNVGKVYSQMHAAMAKARGEA